MFLRMRGNVFALRPNSDLCKSLNRGCTLFPGLCTYTVVSDDGGLFSLRRTHDGLGLRREGQRH